MRASAPVSRGSTYPEVREIRIAFLAIRRLGPPAAIVLLAAFVTLPTSPTAADDSGSVAISGTVRSESPDRSDARPARNIEVRLTFGNKTQTRSTGEDGTYRFADLLAGKYTVKVVAPAGYRVAGDATVGMTLDGKRDVAADFKLLAVVPASPVPTVPATSAPRGGPSPGPLPPTALPPGAIPRTSPVPVGNASPAPSGGARGDSALALSAPSAITVPAPDPSPPAHPPTPVASPREVPTVPRREDVQANAPARRPITSFAALRDSGGEASVGQLRAYATDTSLMLGVPFKTQIDGSTYSLVNCGPASLAMVLGAYGIDVDPMSLRDYLNSLVGNFDTEIGTSLDTLGRIAREAGLSTLGLYGRGGYHPWTVEDIREYILAGHPVITLTKYRKLPGHLGSQTDFDHYVVITGLAGDDFVYNDAAFATEYGRNLVISPAELEQAWAASSIPRQAMAVGLGETIRPLPIVPRRLQPEALASRPGDAVVDAEAAESIERVQAPAPAEWPLNMVPGRATQNLRERLLDELGARSSIVGEDEDNLRVLHPSDVARLATIRIPAEARPEGEAPARLVVPGAIEELDALAEKDVAEEVSGASAPQSMAEDAVAPVTVHRNGSGGGSKLTGLIGLGLFITAWLGRRRRPSNGRHVAAERAARSSADVDL